MESRTKFATNYNFPADIVTNPPTIFAHIILSVYELHIMEIIIYNWRYNDEETISVLIIIAIHLHFILPFMQIGAGRSTDDPVLIIIKIGENGTFMKIPKSLWCN
jgi:hypothetical protein